MLLRRWKTLPFKNDPGLFFFKVDKNFSEEARNKMLLHASMSFKHSLFQSEEKAECLHCFIWPTSHLGSWFIYFFFVIYFFSKPWLLRSVLFPPGTRIDRTFRKMKTKRSFAMTEWHLKLWVGDPGFFSWLHPQPFPCLSSGQVA